MMFLVSLLSILFTGLGYIAYIARRRRMFLGRSWESVLAKLEPVDVEGLRRIAESYLNPGKDQLSIEPPQMWDMIGGLRGLHRLHSNAAIMLDLAVFAERWNWEQGPVISEMIRRDVARLNSAVRHIELAFVYQFGFVRAPFHIQEAVSSYYLLRGRLLGLYEASHAGLLPRLEAAV